MDRADVGAVELVDMIASGLSKMRDSVAGTHAAARQAQGMVMSVPQSD
jgi:hypothetical protein